MYSPLLPLIRLIDMQEVFDAPSSKNDKKGNRGYKDSEYYMAYVQKDADTEKGCVDITQHVVLVSDPIPAQVLSQGWRFVRRTSPECYV